MSVSYFKGEVSRFFFQAEDGIRDHCVTGVQTCALPISGWSTIQSFSRNGNLRFPDVLWIVLHPARSQIYLRQLLLCRRYCSAWGIDDDRSRAGCPLIDRKSVV